MVHGRFVENIPIIPLTVAWGHAVQSPFVILDTGFTGDLALTSTFAKELGLEVVGVTTMKLANGQIIDTPTALALVSLEGKTHYIQVLISESVPLAGINLLTQFSCKAVIDCKNREVTLESI